MAKAQFHKNQRVYVKPVGTWAVIEKVLPHWTKGLSEPLRIFYDVGLGREFSAEELLAEEAARSSDETMGESWRIVRAKNKWQQPDECTHHPQPGTYPVVVTGEKDWGGWRVPGAEYDLDPNRIELQARIIASSLRLLDITRRLVEFVASQPENCSNELISLARDSEKALRDIQQDVA
jgi:hypothetical protein